MGTAPKNTAFVVINPAARGGLGRRDWPRVARELGKSIGSFESAETKGIGHGRILAFDAAKAGYHLIIAYGGDGTIHEVVNGIYQANLPAPPTLGILSAGTGEDLIRTLKFPKSLLHQIKVVAGHKERLLDLGRIEYTSPQGNKERMVFVNVADAGLGAEVVRRLSRSRNLFSRKLAYLSSTLTSYFSWDAKEIRISTEPELNEDWPKKILTVVVANGQYFGGGMPIAPTSRPDDGYFDLIVVGDMATYKALLSIPFLYAKQLVHFPNVHFKRVKSVSLTSPEPVDLLADGERIGSLPARFEIIPQSLRVKCP